MIQRKAKGFFFLNQPFHSKRKMCRSLVCVSAGGREYLQESQRCSAKGVQISDALLHLLKGYNERFKDDYLPSASSP